MLDIGWQELFIIAVFAILVVGPKDLPRMLKTVMQWIRKARGLAREFQSGVDEMVREADLDDLKKDIGSISKPGDLTKSIVDTVDPTGELGDIQKDLDKTARDATREEPSKNESPKDEEDEPENPFKNKSGDELRALMVKEQEANAAAVEDTDTATDTKSAPVTQVSESSGAEKANS